MPELTYQAFKKPDAETLPSALLAIRSSKIRTFQSHKMVMASLFWAPKSLNAKD